MASGTKFACLCVRAFPVVDVPDARTSIGHGYSISSQAEGLDPHDWSEALGTFQIDEVVKADLWVWVEAHSENAEVLDHENEALMARLVRFWWALLLHEPPQLFSAWALSGRQREQACELRSVNRYAPVFNHQGCRTQIDVETLRQAAATAAAYERIVSSGGLRGRVHQGFVAFTSAMGERHVDPAHLGLERALEGILHPARGVQFVKRGAAIIRDLSRDDGDATELLRAIYDMRSGFTHCETLANIFPDLDQAAAERRGVELRNATYTLAARAYREVLRNEELARRFGCEGQGEYWGRVVQGRIGPPFVINLEPEDWQSRSDR